MQEIQSAATCLHTVSAHSVLLVTSDYHTRRALSAARTAWSGYAWSVAAANHGLLSAPRWGTSREVAKDVFLEWQKLVWWELVDRHR